MDKIVIVRAKIKTENIYNEGYICIDKENNIIEGILGLDYIKIEIFKNIMTLSLHENLYFIYDGVLRNAIRDTTFISKKLYCNELYCPDEYYLYGNNSETMLLTLEGCEYDTKKIKIVLENLNRFRP